MCFPKVAGEAGQQHGPLQQESALPTLARSLIDVKRPDMQSASSIVLLSGLPTPDASFMASNACTAEPNLLTLEVVDLHFSSVCTETLTLRKEHATQAAVFSDTKLCLGCNVHNEQKVASSFLQHSCTHAAVFAVLCGRDGCLQQTCRVPMMPGTTPSTPASEHREQLSGRGASGNMHL